MYFNVDDDELHVQFLQQQGDHPYRTDKYKVSQLKKPAAEKINGYYFDHIRGFWRRKSPCHDKVYHTGLKV